MLFEEPNVAIITINYNHSKETIECINSILNSNYSNYDIYLIDNGSNIVDYNRLQEEFYNVNKIKLLRIENNKGYVGGVNFGLKNALKKSYRYFIIMNNDTILDKEAIAELVKTAIKYEDNAIISGKVYNMDEPNTLQYIGQWCKNKNNFEYIPYVKNFREVDIGQFDEEIELDMTDDICWLIPRKIIQKVGLYSEDFFLYGEQNDYVFRAKAFNFKLIYTPQAKIWHHHHLTTANKNSKSLKIYYWQSYATLILMYKYLNKVFFIKKYFKIFSKTFTRLIIYTFFKRLNYERQKCIAWFLANKEFIKWLLGKNKINTGYNPFSD